MDAPPPTEPVVATPMEEEEVKEEEVKEEEVKEEEVEEEVVVSSSLQEMKLAEAEKEQNLHAYSVAFATAVAAEAAVAAAKAAAEIVRLTAVAHYNGKSKEEIAAIKIQTAYRGYMVRSHIPFFVIELVFCEVLAGSGFFIFQPDKNSEACILLYVI